MDRKEFVASLRALGLRVTAQGMTSYRSLQWGYVGGTAFQTPDGTIIPFEDMEQLSFNDMDGKLTIDKKDGGFTIVSGGQMNASDVTVMQARQMPRVTLELNEMFPMLFPDCEDQLYYDELMERNVMDMSMLDRPGNGPQPFTDGVMALYHEQVQLRLREIGCQGRFPSKDVMDEVLTIRTYDHRRNPFREWMESHTWDGVPRVRTWFQTLFGATAPPLHGEEEEKYLGDMSEVWFLTIVRRQYRPSRLEVVPVLMGDQGIGKGLAIKYMTGQDSWYKDTNADIKDMNTFLDTIRGRIVVELSESRQIRNNDSELLKSFISQEVDQIRKPYAKYEDNFPRHFGLISTTNLKNIFTDITGNRRYFPVFCDGRKHTRKFSIDRSVGQYEVEQVWAEALHMYRTRTGRWYVMPDTTKLARMVQNFYTVENPGIALISDHLDDDPFYSKVGAKISRAEIMELCFGVSADRLVSKEMESAYRAWTNGDKAWKKVSTFRSPKTGKPARGFERVFAPGEDPDADRLGIVDGDEGKPTAIQELYRVIEENDLEIGDDFPTDGLEDYVIANLLDKEVISSSKPGRYILRDMP